MSSQGYLIGAVCVTCGWFWTRRFGGSLGAALFLAFCASGILFLVPFAVDDRFPHRMGQDVIDAVVTGLVWSGFLSGFFGVGTLIATLQKVIAEDWIEK